MQIWEASRLLAKAVDMEPRSFQQLMFDSLGHPRHASMLQATPCLHIDHIDQPFVEGSGQGFVMTKHIFTPLNYFELWTRCWCFWLSRQLLVSNASREIFQPSRNATLYDIDMPILSQLGIWFSNIFNGWEGNYCSWSNFVSWLVCPAPFALCSFPAFILREKQLLGTILQLSYLELGRSAIIHRSCRGVWDLPSCQLSAELGW